MFRGTRKRGSPNSARHSPASESVIKPEFARSLSETLAANGYIVETATDAEEALETAKRFDAGVALIDVRLGGSSGLDLVPNLRRGRPGLICAMMAELAAFETAVDALRAGADDYLTKPLDMTWLFATLERCFARRLLRNEEEAAEAAVVSDSWWKLVFGVAPDHDGCSIRRRGQSAS